MKTILIGLGDIAPKHIEVFREFNCEVVGVLTRNYDRGVSKANRLGIGHVFKSLEEISHEECDFFTILTSPENNGKVLKKLLPFKKPIFTEKPVTFSSKEMDEIIELQKNYNFPVMVEKMQRE